MSKWKTVKLGEVGVIITGNTPKTSDKENYLTNDISFYRPSDIVERNVSYLNSSEAYVSEVARSKVRMLPKGSILVTCIGIIGKIGILEHEATFNQQINAIIPNQDICLNRYIAYSIFFNRDRLRDIANAPVVPIVNKTQFSNMIIPLPPLEEQKHIADILDKASNLIDLRKQQLEKMDLLIKSKFIEMFGDPVTNPKGWDVKTLADICSLITDGTHQTPQYVEEGYIFLSSKNVTTGKIDWSNIKHISENLHKELYKRLKPRKGDILLAKNGTTGIAAIVDKDVIFDIYVSLALLRPKQNVVSLYLLHGINNFATKRQFDDSLKGIGVPNLHLNAIREVKLILPPAELQNQFAEFVEQVEKQKTVMQQSLEKMETNYKSLMQEYFG